MKRILLLSLIISAGCMDSSTTSTQPTKQTTTATPTTPAKVPFKEPEPEIR